MIIEKNNMFDENLYTIIIEVFNGGTYISQIYAEDEYISIKKWGYELLENNIIDEFTNDDVKMLVNQINDKECSPVKVKDRINVWCSFFNFNNMGVLLNIIKTSFDI